MCIRDSTYSAHSEGDDLVVGGAGWRGLTIYGEGGGGVIQFADNADNRIGQILYNHGDNSMIFRVNGNQTRFKLLSDGHALFSGLTSSNDSTRNVKGITLKSTAGISFQNFGANGSKNWRIRPDDASAWGALDFSVGDDANSSTSWPSGSGDLVLSLRGNRDVHVDNGNLVFGTSGKGIDFSNVSGSNSGSNSAVLDDYEEGTYTPTTNTNLTLQSSYDIFAYIKVGRMCTVRGLFYPNNNPSGNYAMTFSLPFTAYNYTQIAGAGGSGVMHRFISGASNGVAVYVEDGATIAKFYKNGGSGNWGPVYNTDWNSAMEIYVDFTYFTI